MGIIERAKILAKKMKFTATRVDLVFGSNSVLRSYAEVYARVVPFIRMCCPSTLYTASYLINT